MKDIKEKLKCDIDYKYTEIIYEVYGDTKRMSEPYKRMFDPILSKKDFKQIRTAFLSVNYFNDFIEENKLVL